MMMEEVQKSMEFWLRKESQTFKKNKKTTTINRTF
jgi:hypothetical protein